MITSIEQLLEIYNVKSEEELDWVFISINLKLSESFIEKHSNKVKWVYISINQKLSESFIDRNSDKMDWRWISMHQKLSETFIEKHSDKVYWRCICIYQTLSKEFFIKHWENIPIISLVKECGKEKRTIYRLKGKPEIIHLGCFKGTKEEAIKAIKEKYQSKPVAMQQYIDKVEECFNSTLID